RRLSDVLGVRRVARDRQGVAVDVADVGAVETLEGAVRGLEAEGERHSGRRLDARENEHLRSALVLPRAPTFRHPARAVRMCSGAEPDVWAEHASRSCAGNRDAGVSLVDETSWGAPAPLRAES